MPAFLLLLKDYWYVVVIAALIALAGFLKISNASLKTDLAEAKTQYVQLEGEFGKLKILTEQCNATVAALGQAKKELDQNLKVANEKLKADNAQQAQRIVTLRSAQVPQSCEGSVVYMAKTVQAQVSNWKGVTK